MHQTQSCGIDEVEITVSWGMTGLIKLSVETAAEAVKIINNITANEDAYELFKCSTGITCKATS